MNERMETNNPEATEALGEKLGREARAGQIYCLSGDLGVGKTVFTKGFAKGLGITEHVTSPTFAIVNEYEGRLPLYHFDVYRHFLRGGNGRTPAMRNIFTVRAFVW